MCAPLMIDGIRKCPAELQTLPEFLVVDVEMPSPFSQRQCFTLMGDVPTASPIVGLLGRCSPIAVRVFVSLVVICAVNAVYARWLVAHIINKVFVGFKPPRADRNASASVINVLLIPNVVAFVFKFLPRIKLSALSFPMFEKMRVRTTPYPRTTTGLRVSRVEVVGLHNGCPAAFADAIPSGFFLFTFSRGFSLAGYGKFAEFLASKVSSFHNNLRKITRINERGNWIRFPAFGFDALATIHSLTHFEVVMPRRIVPFH